ncbi:MAG: U32 family peptidase, partial [Deltaproteobacteria bacterium]|nr:U32 family peptidase [Deltaproteobacteria bacterium]
MAKRIRTQSANDETALSSMPELLAPAGGPASWAAAMEAGADAIYAGLDRFSARSYAENFTLPELKGLIEESHRQDVKIYLAFNSAVKEQELPLAFRTMMMVCELGPPDGLIIQDLGLAYLAKRHLPTIPLHASTLTAVHSLDGLKSLRNLGFTRAVLPRELTVREIADIAHRSPIGVEIFIHGSLCFSFSGLCLMSSFLGGRSALRGGCTQPCRRAYQNAGRQATFFSPSDFSLAPFILDLKKLPISSFKIEGRMKGPDYVGQVVAAYRALIDSNDNDFPEALERAREMLARVPSRPVTERGFINGEPMAESLWNRQAVSGIKLGSIEPAANNLSQVRLLNPLHLGDRVRLVAGYGEEGEPKKIKKILSVDLTPITEAEAGQIVNLDLTSLSTQNSQNSSGSQSSPGSKGWPNSQSSQGSQGSHNSQSSQGSQNSQSSHDSKGSPNSQSSHGSPPLTGQLYLVGSSALEKNYLASEPVKRLKAAAK